MGLGAFRGVGRGPRRRLLGAGLRTAAVSLVERFPMTLIRASGWYPDLPDRRDYTLDHERVGLCLSDLPELAERPSSVEWRTACTPCPERLDIGECGGSIHCCLELLEQTLFRVQGSHRALSRPFVHHNAERMAQAQGEPPLSLRMAWKTIQRIGVLAESLWPAEPGCQPLEPDAFAYGAASHYPELRYVRLDHRDRTGAETLDSVRSCLAAGFLCSFGIPLGSTAGEAGEIAFPTAFDDLQGGQALLAVGYDDRRRIRSDRGCLLVRGGWGRDWGEEGYGWLPYAYVREKLALDFWTIFDPAWLPSGEFHRPE